MRRFLLRRPAARPAARTRLALSRLEDRATPAMFEVTTAADSGAGSLRQTIADAAANAEADEIRFNFAVSGQTIELLTPLSVTETQGVTIFASSNTLDGKDAVQLLTVAAGGKATVSGMTFTKGQGTDGGAVNTAGTLTLINCTLTANTATGDGGAIYNSGTLTLTGDDVVTGCSVSKNTAGGSGGGVANKGVLVVDRSTIGATTDGTNVTVGNTAGGAGGGLWNAPGGKLTVFNSTITKNTAGGTGGGLRNASAEFAKLTNTTVAFNLGGGGVQTAVDAKTYSYNSLYVSNTGGDLLGEALIEGKFNLVADAGSAGGLTNGTDGNIVGVAAPADVLGSFENEGGASSYPLKAGSPGIDKGSTALAVDAAGKALTVDQTNFANSRVRPAAGTVDIGAREFVVVAPFTYAEDGQTIETQKNQPKTLTGLIVQTTYTDPTVVTLTVNDGKLTFSDPLPGGVTNVTGNGTGTLMFTATKGALFGGAGAGLTFTPSTDAVYAAGDGKTLTIKLANGANPVVTFSSKLAVTAPVAQNPAAPLSLNTATLVDTVQLVTIDLDQTGAVRTNKLVVDGITGGKLFTDDKLTAEVTNGKTVDATFPNGFPRSSVPLYFQPTAGFTGTGSFSLKAVDINGTNFSAAVTNKVQVVAAGTPFVAGDNPGVYATTVGPRLDGAATYDFLVLYQDDKGVLGSKLADGDLTVTARQGTFTQAAKFVGASADGKQLFATYRITAPGGTFDAADKGFYLVSLAAGKLRDADGNAAPAQDLFNFSVDVSPQAVGDPTAKLTAPAVTAADSGKDSYTFTVTFADNSEFNVATVQGKDDLVYVVGPNGFFQQAKFVSLDVTTNGTPRVATYKITPPGGDWDATDNGTYTAGLFFTAADAAGNLVPGGYLGTFTASGLTAPAADPVASFTATAGTESEGRTTDVVVTVSLDQPAPDNLFIQIAFSGTATLNDPAVQNKVFDYSVNGFQIAPYTVQVAKGATTGTLSLKLLDDTLVEPTETAVFTIDPGSAGITVGAKNAFTLSITDNDAPVVAGPKPTLVGSPQYAVGTDRGGNGSVRFFNPDNSARLVDPLQPFGSFTGGVRTAAADFTGDGVADIVVGTGPGRATQVQVFDGATLKQLFSIDPFEAAFTGGVFVAAGDANGDGKAELVVTPDEGGGPVVAVYGPTGTQVARFFGIEDPNFRGGARAAVGDLDGDGKADILVAAGFGGGPRIAGFNGSGLAATGAPPKLFSDFFAFEGTLRNGTFVAVGDTDGDGKAEIVAGGGPGGGPRVSTFRVTDIAAGKLDNRLADFFAGDSNSRGGVRLAVKNLDGDNLADIVTGAGTGAGSKVTTYSGKALAAKSRGPDVLGSFDAIGGFTGGVFVG